MEDIDKDKDGFISLEEYIGNSFLITLTKFNSQFCLNKAHIIQGRKHFYYPKYNILEVTNNSDFQLYSKDIMIFILGKGGGSVSI